METVTEQPIIKIEFFRCPQSLPGVAPLTKKPEDSGYEIGDVRKRASGPVERETHFRSVFQETPLLSSRWRITMVGAQEGIKFNLRYEIMYFLP